jgi:Anti-sigma-K factor rskA/Putative zinc-finger
VTEEHESTGTYALNALDPTELTEFEAHLATCATCSDEVAGFCETAAELFLLNLAAPPPTLRDNILAAIRTTPQIVIQGEAGGRTPPVRTNGSRPAAESRLDAASIGARRAPQSEASELAEEPQPQPDELALRRQRRRTRILSGLVAAMLALAVGLGGVVYTLVQERQAQIAATTLEQQLYAAPDAVTTATALPGGGQVTFIASRQLNRALFLGTDLPDPGQNRYQLWTANGTDLKNRTEVFRDVQVADTESGIKVFFSGDIASADLLAVNLEPAGSAPVVPTKPLLASGPTTII